MNTGREILKGNDGIGGTKQSVWDDQCITKGGEYGLRIPEVTSVTVGDPSEVENRCSQSWRLWTDYDHDYGPDFVR